MNRAWAILTRQEEAWRKDRVQCPVCGQSHLHANRYREILKELSTEGTQGLRTLALV